MSIGMSVSRISSGVVDDLGLHEGFQQRLPSLSTRGEFHLSMENFPVIGPGIYVHFDAISPMRGPLSVIGHGVFEIIPSSFSDPVVRDAKVDFNQ